MSITSNQTKSISMISDKVILQNVQSATDGGGQLTSGGWRTTPLNTIAYSRQTTSSPWMTLSSNQFTLQPGTYMLNSFIQSFHTDEFQGRIRNVAGTTVSVSQPGISTIFNNPNLQGGVFFADTIDLSSSSTFELQIQVLTTYLNDRALGVDTNNGVDNVFSEVEITKLN